MKDLKTRLKNLDVSKLKMKNGKTIEEEMKRHAAILADCIQYELDAVYNSYSPKYYNRTFGLYNSLHIGDMRIDVSSSGTDLSIKLEFDDGAIHKGLDGSDADTAILINDGWQTHGSFADVPYFGYREATHFIENGISDYKRSTINPFNVRLTKNGMSELF
ncbi:hypothetical protein [Clostridium sp. HBUAS56010]|uniref:hypothetical protein n=1 Tax=Clostridium sp. HBUAS56010 TaxID=2571127 RepID=UPI0011782E79|nr:hypothetical protein [Clostridium sp. HBUAS56010]